MPLNLEDRFALGKKAFKTIKNLLLVVVMEKKFNKIHESNPNCLINLNKFIDGGQSIPGLGRMRKRFQWIRQPGRVKGLTMDTWVCDQSGMDRGHFSQLHQTSLQLTALHCTVMHCTVLHCTALNISILECAALHFSAQNSVVVFPRSVFSDLVSYKQTSVS